MYNNIYNNKKVFITGHTGFKGSWLSLWLTSLGAKVCGYSLEPNTTPSLFKILNLEKCISSSIIADITDFELLKKSILEFQPDIVFHLAAQPLVRESYRTPILTYQTNVMGSLNVLEASRLCASVKAVVNITTDKCYENKENLIGYKEDSPMGGYDMYSSSKGCVEIMSASYRNSFLKGNNSYALATARAGNVIGGGDWAKDRLIPDCIRALNTDGKIILRNPMSIRPWQHVLEPLSGYLLLGQKLLESSHEYAEGFNFGPNKNDIHKVKDIAENICKIYGKGEVIVEDSDHLHEANLLLLNIEKAKDRLGWMPAYDTYTGIRKTVEWYKTFYENLSDIRKFSLTQIKEYEKSIKWNKN